jgi:hypothetical protein
MVGSLDEDATVGTGEFACECGCECESMKLSGIVSEERLGAREVSIDCCCCCCWWCCGIVWALIWACSWSWDWRGVWCCWVCWYWVDVTSLGRMLVQSIFIASDDGDEGLFDHGGEGDVHNLPHNRHSFTAEGTSY